jgi:3-oxoacyl-[acyl-carrier-protein] synthase-3
MIRAAITGVSGYVPDDLLTNADLEKMVDTNDEWIRTRTGIETRHILKGEGKGTSDLLAPAVQDLLKKTGTKPEEVGAVIVGTVTPDHVFPSTANILCEKVGIKDAMSFDISAACSGFLFALSTGSQFIETGMYKKVIVCGGDKMSSIVDYEDRATCIIFGDGGGAVMLEPDESGVGIMDSILRTDGSGQEFLHMKAGGSVLPASHETVDNRMHYAYQEGRTVFKFAVTNMADVSAEIMERNHLTGDDVQWLVPHQANLRIIDATANRMGLSDDKVMVNIQRYGNTTAGTIPLCLWEWEDRLKRGDNIVLAAFGGGFTWGAIYLKWAYDGKAKE